MRRMLVNALTATTAAVALLTATGCAPTPGREAASPGASGAGDRPAGVNEAEVYVQVLRRYLGTPADNSFPGRTFKKIFVLDRAVPGIGDPRAKPSAGTTLPGNTQRMIVDALGDLGPLSFISDPDTVMVKDSGCATVKDDGILITLGPPVGDDNRVEVGVNGFVACLGATWLTYVVEHQVGTGWRVTGTTGAMAVA